jgi:hypothetical protein
VALVGSDVSEERIAYIFRVGRISELGTELAVTSNCSTPGRINHYMRKEEIEWDMFRGGRERELLVVVSLSLRLSVTRKYSDSPFLGSGRYLCEVTTLA